jgi:cytochrome P450
MDWCRRRYGGAFTMWIPPWGDVAIFTSPAEVKQVFTSDATGGKVDGGRAYHKIFQLLMGHHSMFSLEGEDHLRLRKMLMKAFKGRAAADQHRASIEEIAAAEVDTWPVGDRINLEEAAQQLTLAVVIRNIFGVSDTDHERGLRELLPRYVNVGALIQLEIAFPKTRRLGPGRRHHRVRAQTRALVREVIDRRRAVPDLDQRTDTLSVLMGMEDDDGKRLTDDELVDFCMTLLLAGHETTSAQLTWIVEELIRNPDTLERLRAEIRDGGEDYLEAVIKEGMRLQPALPYIERGALTEVEIGKYRLPAGIAVGIGISALHHGSDVYEDANVFRPERFLGGESPAPHSWVPWGGGRRKCAGQHFATVEMKAVLTTLLRRVELAPWRAKREPPVGKAVTMVPRRGGEMVVKRRLLPVGAPPRGVPEPTPRAAEASAPA